MDLWASRQVAEGVDARTAWERCGKPKGDKGIQNIRKRGLKLRKIAAPPPPARAATKRKSKGGLGKGKPAKGFRLSSKQAKVKHELELKAKADSRQLGRQLRQSGSDEFVRAWSGQGVLPGLPVHFVHRRDATASRWGAWRSGADGDAR